MLSSSLLTHHHHHPRAWALWTVFSLAWGTLSCSAFVPRQHYQHLSTSTTSTFGSRRRRHGLSSSSLKAHKKKTDSFDLNDLKKRITETSSPYADGVLFRNSDGTPNYDNYHEEDHVLPDDFYVVVVSPGTEQQGVHTIEYPAGSGSNVMLAFESHAAAHKFAQLLQQQQAAAGFDNPQPVQFAVADLEEFCQQLGIFAQFVPAGVDLIPPVKNVEQFGHKDPTLREKQQMLDYIFSMDETDMQEQEGLMMGVETVPAGCWD